MIYAGKPDGNRRYFWVLRQLSSLSNYKTSSPGEEEVL
jgi:hypothetical protein